MTASDYEAARERHEQAWQDRQEARQRFDEAGAHLDDTEDAWIESVRNLRRFESAPGIPLPQNREQAA